MIFLVTGLSMNGADTSTVTAVTTAITANAGQSIRRHKPPPDRRSAVPPCALGTESRGTALDLALKIALSFCFRKLLDRIAEHRTRHPFVVFLEKTLLRLDVTVSDFS